jgi:hypothetical protein
VFECVITDTIEPPRVIEVLLTRVEREDDIDHERVESLVEKRAGRYKKPRVEEMEAERRLALPDYRLEPAD